MLRSFNRPLVTAVLLTLVGCASQPHPSPVIISAPAPVREQPAPANPEQPSPAVTRVAPPPVTHNAVESLIKQARHHYAVRDYQSAIATAERGLRIDRRAADLYLVLAQSYIQLALPQKAKVFVQQGLRYAPVGSDTAGGLQRAQTLLGD